eukprot:g2478.t1
MDVAEPQLDLSRENIGPSGGGASDTSAGSPSAGGPGEVSDTPEEDVSSSSSEDEGVVQPKDHSDPGSDTPEDDAVSVSDDDGEGLSLAAVRGVVQGVDESSTPHQEGGGATGDGETSEERETLSFGELASKPVWQRMISSETFNHFLHPEDLAEAIDEDEEEISMILRFAKPFLRAHGIIPREFRGRMAWCLVGIGPMYLTLSPRLLAHAMSAEPNGILFGGMDVRSNGLVATKGSDNLTEICFDSVALASDIQIHVGEPLPTRGKTGEAWSLSDVVVEAVGHTCPVKEKAPATTRKRTDISGASRRKRGNSKGNGTGNPRKKGKAAKNFALPEHTSAGSNTDKNAELASEIREGGAARGRREASVCAACLGAGVRRDFLLSNKHARKGPKICLAIQKKFRQEGGHASATSDDGSSEDSSGSYDSSSE